MSGPDRIWDWAWEARPEVQAIVEAAVKAEREACAKVCEEWGAWNNTAQAIAHVIRKRGEGKP